MKTKEEEKKGLSRRNFLKIGIAAGAVATAGIYFKTGGEKLKSDTDVWPRNTDNFAPNAWISIGSDNSVTVRINHTEMGQGITTALAMIVAEELDADWKDVRTEIAPAEALYKNPEYNCQMTAGSTSVKGSWKLLRKAGAAARQLLIFAAAAKWKVNPEKCMTRKGKVILQGTTQSFKYGDLIDSAIKITSSANVTLKSDNKFKIIGTSQHRLDSFEKTYGKAVFGIDVNIPGMLQATVIHPPAIGARCESFNISKIKKLKGVKSVIEISTGVAVIADTFWNAKSAADKLDIQWSNSDIKNVTSKNLSKRWKELSLNEGKTVFEIGHAKEIFEKDGKVIEAAYEVPFQGHATPEPMNCTAHVKKDFCEIWAPTQNQDEAQEAAARLTGLGYNNVKINTTFVGGGFGRRVDVDYVKEAVEISMSVNAPVKVIWTREEDMKNDFFRPGSFSLLRAAVNKQGIPVGWLHRIVGPDHMSYQLPKIIPTMLPYGVPRLLRNAATAVAGCVLPSVIAGKRANQGASPLNYNIKNVSVEFINDDPGVPLGFWRSVSYSQNTFFVESFIDELAYSAGRDPLEYRLELLSNDPRIQEVLKLAAAKAKWEKNKSGKRNMGIAAFDFHGTKLAAVAEISIRVKSTLKIDKVICAVDCGVAINPQIIKEQIRSGIIFGLTAALKNKITFTNGRVDQSNFSDFPIIRMNEAPDIDVYIVNTNNPPTGIGESAVPIIAPALANAVFASTGKRVRHLPIVPEDLS